MFINFIEYDEHDNEPYYDKQTTMKKNFDKIFIEFIKFETTCKHCHKIFLSHNKLHYHLRKNQCTKKSLSSKSIVLLMHTASKKTFIKPTKLSEIIIYSTDILDSKLSKIIKSFVLTKNLNYDIDFRN